MDTFIFSLHVVLWPLCVICITLILLQGGAGDISSAFGGGGQLDSALGVGASRKTAKLTAWIAGAIALVVILLDIPHHGPLIGPAKTEPHHYQVGGGTAGTAGTAGMAGMAGTAGATKASSSPTATGAVVAPVAPVAPEKPLLQAPPATTPAPHGGTALAPAPVAPAPSAPLAPAPHAAAPAAPVVAAPAASQSAAPVIQGK